MYFVGQLKSFNREKGYGFIDSYQIKSLWGMDVFIHKNLVPDPWTIGCPVEFRVNVNASGKPQADDVMWLEPLSASGSATAASSQPAVQSNGHDGDVPTSSQRSQPHSSNKVSKASLEGKRTIGYLKSYHSEKNYGFITCPQAEAIYSRDVYLDRSQLPSGTPKQNVLVDFECTLNSKGQPQARDTKWEELDQLPLIEYWQNWEKNREPNSTLSQGGLKAIRGLLEHTIRGEANLAVELAGDRNDDKEDHFEFCGFLLDRWEESADAMLGRMSLTNVNMLLLRLSERMNCCHNQAHFQQAVRWICRLAEKVNLAPGSADPKSVAVAAQSVRKVHTRLANAQRKYEGEDVTSAEIGQAIATLEEKIGEAAEVDK